MKSCGFGHAPVRTEA